MTTKSIARFSINVHGHPRSLFSVRQRSGNEIVLGLSSTKYDAPADTPTTVDSLKPLIEHRYSIHPSLGSEQGVNVIKQTRIVEGTPPQFTYHHTKVIKKGENFALIFCRRCNNLIDDFLIPTKESRTETSLGELDPECFTLVYAVIIGAREIDFVIPEVPLYSPLNQTHLTCSNFRITVLWAFNSVPAHNTYFSGHFLTLNPTTEEEARMMMGRTAEDCIALFMTEFFKFHHELIEKHRGDRGDITANKYDWFSGIFSDGRCSNPKYLEHQVSGTAAFLKAVEELKNRR